MSGLLLVIAGTILIVSSGLVGLIIFGTSTGFRGFPSWRRHPQILWPILNFIDRKQYSSEWAWIGEWLEVIEDKVFIKDDAWWAANLAKVTARFKEWQLAG